jgi:hypothetical protein
MNGLWILVLERLVFWIFAWPKTDLLDLADISRANDIETTHYQ